MIYSNTLKPGSSFLEVMIAIILLAIFGTSIFQVQTYIFSHTSKAHQNVQAFLKFDKIIPECRLEIFNSIRTNDSINTLQLPTTTNPETTEFIRIKPIAETSSLYSDFGNTTKILEQKVIVNNKEEKKVSFTFFIS